MPRSKRNVSRRAANDPLEPWIPPDEDWTPNDEDWHPPNWYREEFTDAQRQLRDMVVRIARARRPDKRQSMIEACARLLSSGDGVCADTLTLVQATVVALSPGERKRDNRGAAIRSFQSTIDFMDVDEFVAGLVKEGIDPREYGSAAIEVAQRLTKEGIDLRKPRTAIEVARAIDLLLAAVRKANREAAAQGKKELPVPPFVHEDVIRKVLRY
jgi:hypothetical protein